VALVLLPPHEIVRLPCCNAERVGSGGGFQWQNFHTRFGENRSVGSKNEMGTHTHTHTHTEMI
jgi:hypothetical protein